MRLPTRVNLPFGYIVKVKLATGSEMKNKDGQDCDGLWDSDTRTIYVRKALPVKRQRYILVHELVHAMNDYLHAALDAGAAKP